MENVVLGLLIIQSLTLYELNQAFKQGISMFYSASYGSLQIAVKNLLKKQMIVFQEKVDNGRNKKVYSITEQGRATFYRWMLNEIPISKLEVTALAKVYFLGLIQSIEERQKIIHEILCKIDMVQDELNSLNEEITQFDIPDPYREVFNYQLKTLDYGRKSYSFASEWFQDLLSDLESRKKI